METQRGLLGRVLQEAGTLKQGDRIQIYSKSHGRFRLLAQTTTQIRAIKQTEQPGNPAVLTTTMGSFGGGTLVDVIPNIDPV